MNKEACLLAIDQGTSETKAAIFDTSGRIVAQATEPLKSYFPQPGFEVLQRNQQGPIHTWAN